jgi:hypothetical protein
MDDFETIHSILTQFAEEDLVTLMRLLREYKKIERRMAIETGTSMYDTKTRMKLFRKRMKDEGLKDDALECACYNEMRKLGMITLDELKSKIRQLDEKEKRRNSE